MKDQTTQGKTLVECPESKKNCEVTFEVNVFRGVNRGGVEVTDCSDFRGDKSHGTCEHDCIHTQESKELHEQAIRQHQAELSSIGPNVIG